MPPVCFEETDRGPQGAGVAIVGDDHRRRPLALPSAPPGEHPAVRRQVVGSNGDGRREVGDGAPPVAHAIERLGALNETMRRRGGRNAAAPVGEPKCQRKIARGKSLRAAGFEGPRLARQTGSSGGTRPLSRHRDDGPWF